MGFKGVLIVIGIVALGVVITFGVEEIRFAVLHKNQIDEIETLKKDNQRLRIQNENFIKQTSTLSSELKAKTEEYEANLLKLEQKIKELESGDENMALLMKKLETLQGKNQELDSENIDLTQTVENLGLQVSALERRSHTLEGENEGLSRQIEDLISQLQASQERITRSEGEKKELENEVGQLRELVDNIKALLGTEE